MLEFGQKRSLLYIGDFHRLTFLLGSKSKNYQTLRNLSNHQKPKAIETRKQESKFQGNHLTSNQSKERTINSKYLHNNTRHTYLHTVNHRILEQLHACTLLMYLHRFGLLKSSQGCSLFLQSPRALQMLLAAYSRLYMETIVQ